MGNYLVRFLKPDIPPAGLELLLNLLPPMAAKHNKDFMRGAIAAGVAFLRSADMGIFQTERWLDEEIKRRELGFTAHDAVRWFRDCNSEAPSTSRATLEMFRIYRPDPSLSVTEAAAKKQVAKILDSAVAMKVGPLTRSRRG